MIEAVALEYRVGGRRVLDDVSTAIEPGLVTALVGPNGAGKSTLLRALAGDIRPRSGVVRLDGTPLHSVDAIRRARHVAVLLQHSRLEFPFRVLDVVLLGRTPHGRGGLSREDPGIGAEALDAVGMLAMRHRAYTELSGGEQQRVQIARVLAQVWTRGADARHLLLDEPLAHQDLFHQLLVLDLLRERARHGVGVCVVLHDLQQAARHADRVVLLKDGRVAAQGAPEHVLTPARVSDVFGVRARLAAQDSGRGPMLVLG